MRLVRSAVHRIDGLLSCSAMPTFRSSLLAVVLAIASSLAYSQAHTLPNPSRTVYKCYDNAGNVAYSDSPCLGAQRLDVEPTRGLNKYSGKERTGTDVSRERQREGFAEAMQPLTGKNPKEAEIFSRRYKLPPEAQRECAALDTTIPSTEQEAKRARGDSLTSVQARLLTLRKRQRDLRC